MKNKKSQAAFYAIGLLFCSVWVFILCSMSLSTTTAVMVGFALGAQVTFMLVCFVADRAGGHTPRHG